MSRSLPARIPAPLRLALALGATGLPGLALARPIPGGCGGPAYGAGVLPGAGFGAAGPGLGR